MIKPLLAVLLIPIFATASPSYDEFLNQNSKAEKTIRHPHYAAMCLAINERLIGQDEFAAFIDWKIWQLVNAHGNADSTNKWLEANRLTLSQLKTSPQNDLLSEYGCKKLTELLKSTYWV